MGGASRFIMILTTPFPPLLHRPTSLTFLRLLTSRLSTTTTTTTRHLTLSSPLTDRHHSHPLLLTIIKSSYRQLHAQPLNVDSEATNSSYKSSGIHPWPEWSHLISILLSSQGNQSPAFYEHGISPEDAFVVYEEKELSDEFIRHASICLAFSRARPELLGFLSRKDIEVIVSNGTPFLFKSAIDIGRRMRAYVGMEGGNVLESDKVTVVDVMKYILSYASNPSVSSEQNNLYSRELVESSVRNLLRQMTEISFGNPALGLPPSEQHLFYGGNEQTPRPLRQNVEMKRGDWICPKCSFMNFARNFKCLECEEPRPKKQLTGREWQCPQCNFFNYGRNIVCLRCDCKRPGAAGANNVHSMSEIGSIGIRLAENEEKATRWFDKVSQSQKSMGDYATSEGDISESSGNRISDSSIRQSLDQIPGQSSPGLTTGDHTMEGNVQSGSVTEKVAQNTDFFKKSESQTDSQNKDKEQAEKSEKWFKRVAELHNVKDLPSAISDEEFPEIMPMRKGENRFVVSKKKDRSLTSPAYKKQVAAEQANSSNFVPFVPFPPGYFARKDTQASVDVNSSTISSTETSSSSLIAENLPEKLDDVSPRGTENNAVQQTVNQVSSSGDWIPNFSGSLGTSQNSFTSHTIGSELQMSGHSREENTFQSTNSDGGSPQLPNQNAIPGWTGKSLEGSAVKEPDRLDMSEEAKAERWFRRVAQIKDISELSQIPDEDFPSIMPMRKGVNRFVVSKRKTPLERRLTSPQYKRSLPTVSSDHMKRDNDNK